MKLNHRASAAAHRLLFTLILMAAALAAGAAPKSNVPSDADAAQSGPGHPWQSRLGGVNLYSMSAHTAIRLFEAGTAGGSTVGFSLHHASNAFQGNPALGGLWRHNFDVRLVRWQQAGAERAAVIFGNHVIKMFALSGGQWQNADGYRDRLRATEFGYELRLKSGALLSFSRAGGGRTSAEYRLDSITDRTVVTGLTYDSGGRLSSVDLPGGRRIAFSYLNRRLSAVTVETAAGIARRFGFGFSGGQLRRIDLQPVTTDSGIRNYSYSFDYDQGGRITALADPLGNISRTAYSNGLIAGIQWPGNTASERVLFAAAGALRSVTDPIGSVRQFEFDANARLTRYRDPLGNDTAFEFGDPDYGFGPSRATFPSIVDYEWDFDYNGNVAGWTDAAGGRWDFAFDAANNLTQALAPLVTDASGTAEAARRRTDFVYDGFDRLTETRRFTDASNYVSEHREYDASGNLARLTDPLGNAWDFSFDAFGNLVGMSTPEGRTRSWLYESSAGTAGFTSPNAFVDGNGVRLDLGRDEWGRLLTVRRAGARLSGFSYDALSRVTSASNQNGVRLYAFDANGRLTTESYDGGTTAYAYLPNGRLASVTDSGPSGTDTHIFSRNARGDVVAIDHNGAVSQFGYDADGRLISESLPNGSGSTFGYLNGRLANSVYLDSVGTVVMGFQYSYQEDGRIKQMSESGSGETAVTRFFYDLPYRALLREDRNGILTGYDHRRTYDAAGRSTTFDRSGQTATFSRDADGNLLAVQGFGPESSEYDGNGRIVRRVRGAEDLRLGYSPTGDLTAMERFDAGQGGYLPYRAYLYDAAGNRLRRTEFAGGTPAGQSRYRYAGGRLSRVDSINGGQTESLRLTTIGGRVTGLERNGESLGLVTDAFAAVRTFTLPNGASAGGNAVYDASGTPLAPPPTGAPDLGFKGGAGWLTEGDSDFLWIGQSQMARPKYEDFKFFDVFQGPDTDWFQQAGGRGNGSTGGSRRGGTVTILDQDLSAVFSTRGPIILSAWDLDNDGNFGDPQKAWDLDNDGLFGSAYQFGGWDLNNDGLFETAGYRHQLEIDFGPRALLSARR